MATDEQRAYRQGITYWFEAEDALQGYFQHIAEQHFPYDQKKAVQLIDCLGQALLPVVAKTGRVENHEKRTPRYLKAMERWSALSAEFLQAGYEMTSFMNRVKRELRQSLGFEGDFKVQQYSLDLVIDWLVDAVDKQKHWLFSYDKLGRIDLFNHSKQQGEGLLKLAHADFKGFRMAGLARGLDYETVRLNGRPAITKDGLRFVRIKSLAALNKAGKDLQNCLRNKPRDNELHLDYASLFQSGRVEFIALCGAQGEVHGLLSVQNGVIQEASGKQSELLNRKYMAAIIDFATDYGLDVTPHVYRTGIVKTTSGLVSYLDLVDRHRHQTLHVAGDLMLNKLRSPYQLHREAFALYNIRVDGILFMHDCAVQAMDYVSANSIAALGCTFLKEISATVYAGTLMTDRTPADMKLETQPTRAGSNIGLVKICKPFQLGHKGYDVVQVMTGEAYAELNSNGNAFLRQYREKLAQRPTLETIFHDITFPPSLR